MRWISGADRPILAISRSPDARLVLRQAALAEGLAQLIPGLKGQIKSAKSHKTHKLAWSLGAMAVAICLGIFIAVPWLSAPLASLATDEWRDRIGRQTASQLESHFGPSCNNGRGQKVLEQLTDRLAQHLPNRNEVIHVAVIDHEMINAFALPGGYIRIFHGLIREADDPGEIAGVLAHEIAHASLRHAEEQTFRQLGYGIVLSTFADSGAVTEIAGSVGIYLSDAAHSRESEAAADRMALHLLEQANISRQGLASFFERVEKMEGKTSDLLRYLSTHPDSGERKKAAEARMGGGEPALSRKDWLDLKTICPLRD